MDRQTKTRTHIKRGALYGAPLCVRELSVYVCVSD